jgi:hypothetical protein
MRLNGPDIGYSLGKCHLLLIKRTWPGQDTVGNDEYSTGEFYEKYSVIGALCPEYGVLFSTSLRAQLPNLRSTLGTNKAAPSAAAT